MTLLLAGLTGLVILLDQITKFVAFKQEAPVAIIPGIIELVHAKNEGIAFGIGSGIKYGPVILGILSIITVLFLLFFYYLYTPRRKIDTVSIALISGGALGNLIDRFMNSGKVLDFIQLKFVNWPAFNFADISIVAGVIILVISIAFDNAEKSNKKTKNQDV